MYLTHNIGSAFALSIIQCWPPTSGNALVGNRYRKTEGDCWLCLPASKYTNWILVSIGKRHRGNPGSGIVLLGDLNVNSIDRSDSQYKHFSSLCLSLQLQEIVQRPTRVTEKSVKCFDLILTNTSYLMNPTATHVDFTDHCLVASSLQGVDRESPANNTRTHCRRQWSTNISDSRLSDALQKQMNLFGTMNGLDNMWSDWKDKFTKASCMWHQKLPLCTAEDSVAPGWPRVCSI